MADTEDTQTETPAKSLVSEDAQWVKRGAALLAASTNEGPTDDVDAEPSTHAAAPSKPKPKPSPKTAPLAAKDADPEKLTVREKVALREQREAIQREAAQLRAQLIQQAEQIGGSLAQREAQAAALAQANENGDYDAMARILGHKDWNALQEDLINNIASPTHKQTKALQRQLEQDRAEREAERQRVAQAQQEAHSRARFQQLSRELEQSEDPVCRAHSGDPEFVRAIQKVQAEYHDGRTTIRPERALRAKRRAGPPLIQQLDELADRHNRGRSGGNSSGAPAAPAKPKPTAPARPAKPKPFDALAEGRKQQQRDTAWTRSAIERLRESMD